MTLLVVAISGCITDDSDEMPDFSIHGFEAVIDRGEGGNTTFTLGEPVHVLDRDRTRRLAYPLVQQEDPRFDPPIYPRVFFLDGAFSVVAEATTCYGFASRCSDTSYVTWQARGNIAPYGIGLPLMIAQTGTIGYAAARPSEEIPFESSTRAESWTLEASLPDNLRLYVPQLAGQLSYRFGQLVPSGPGWNVSAYDAGGLLAAIPAWPKEHQDHPDSSEPGALFPGSKNDPFDIGFSIDALLAGAKDSLASKGTPLAADHCIIDVSVDVAPKNDSGWPALPRSYERTASFMALSAGGGARLIRVDVEIPPVGEPRFDATMDANIPTSLSCTMVAEAGRPAVGISNFINQAENLSVGQSEERSRFSLLVGAARAAAPREPELGWYTYVISWKPEYAVKSNATTWTNHLVAVDALTGWLEFVVAEPSSIWKQTTAAESS